MGGSVLAALLIISIGEWGGGEAEHCAAENCSVARISHRRGEGNCGVWCLGNKCWKMRKLGDDLRKFFTGTLFVGDPPDKT